MEQPQTNIREFIGHKPSDVDCRVQIITSKESLYLK